MYEINLLNSLIKEYKKWTMTLANSSKDIENNILQKDANDKIEEKIVSIGISTLLVYIVTGIIGLFGIATGGVWMVLFFAIGWILSKFINKIIFGSERKRENIREDEEQLLQKLESIQSKHIQIRDEINKKTMIVNFTNYGELKREFEHVVNLLVNYNASRLALKYRLKHSYVMSKYKTQVSKFDEIYANKQRG